MTTPEDIREEYATQVRRLLAGHEKDLAAFEHCWGLSEFRKAYLLVDEFIRRLNLNSSPDFKKADEDFYWAYVS